MKKFTVSKLGSIGYISTNDMRPYETPDNAVSHVFNMRVENGSLEIAKGWSSATYGELGDALPYTIAVGDLNTVTSTRRVQMIDIAEDINSDSGNPPDAQQPASNAKVWCLDFSHDGGLLAAIHSFDGGITAWNTETWVKEDVPDLVADQDGETARPFVGRFNHDSTKFLVGYVDAAAPGPVYFERYTVVRGGTWTKDDLTGTNFASPGVIPFYPRDLSFSPDGNYLAAPNAGGSQGFHVFLTSDYDTEEDLENMPVVGVPQWQTGVWGCHFSPDGNYLAMVSLTEDSGGARVFVWNVVPGGTWTQIATGIVSPDVQHYRCRFSPDSAYLAVTMGNTGTPVAGEGLKVYNTSDWSEVTLTGGAPGERCEDCAWTSDGKYLVVTSQPGVKHLFVYDATAGFTLTEPTDYQADQWQGVACS